MDNFDFNVGKKDIPIVSLTANGLSFNSFCIKALDCPEFINMGIDRENKKFAVKAKTDNDEPSYCFVNDERKKKRVNLTASKIRAEIIRLADINPTRRGIHFYAGFDKDSGMLVVDLTKTIDVK